MASLGFRPRSKQPLEEASLPGMTMRRELMARDPERVGRLVDLTGFFDPEETSVAVELVRERLARGDACGYHFLIVEQRDRLVGYTCYGPIPCTRNSFDLYWVAVHPDFHRKGLGRTLVMETEILIRKAGGHRIYIDTSQRDQYAGTRSFYESCGYRMETILKDFYAPDDGKVIYCKVM
jgi:GNAT superfamily N-acetyltransferase